MAQRGAIDSTSPDRLGGVRAETEIWNSSLGVGAGLVLALCSTLAAADWPQFRGPHGASVASGAGALPGDIGPARHVQWKTPLPQGHSSPVIVGDRLFLTGVRDGRLLTLCLDRASGKVLWEREAPHEQLEEIHSIGSHAQSSPAVDADCVVSFFGSSGLFCYDHDGQLLWQRRMGPFNNTFGAGSSPLLVDGRVILGQDHDADSFLMALDKATGEVLWKTDRSEFPRNYATPVVWEQSGRKQIVMAATLRVVGYDFHTGQELWTVRGISRTVCATPVVGADGALYVAGWAAGGDEGQRIAVEPFDYLIQQVDKNKDGLIQENELEGGAILQRFSQVDRNKDGGLTKAEYEYFRGLFEQGRNLVLCIEPGAKGEATETHVRWRQPKLVPFCASPLFVDGQVFTVKDGGIMQVLDAQTGRPVKQQRLEATGEYYASPVYGDGKVYLADEPGRLTVLDPSQGWTVQHTADFGEDIYATPALVDGRIYLRTARHLYCFGN
jgi:outer membrane protein assembly factor BamB